MNNIKDYIDVINCELFVPKGISPVEYYEIINDLWTNHQHLRAFSFPMDLVTTQIIQLKSPYTISVEQMMSFKFSCSMINYDTNVSYCGISFVAERDIDVMITDMSDVLIPLKKDDTWICIDTTNIGYGDLYAINYELEIAQKINLRNVGLESLRNYYGVITYPLVINNG